MPIFVGVIVGRGDYKIVHNSVFKGATSGAPSMPSFSNGGHTRVRHREFIQDIKSGVFPGQAPYPAGTTTLFNNAKPLPSNYRQPPAGPALGEGFVLNPGCQSTFPWLSGIANNYQKYQWMGLVFEFVTSSGDALTSNNTALGTVVMATDYDTNHKPFTTKRLMENSDYAASCKPSLSMLHGIECDPKMNPLKVSYVRPDYPAERDIPNAVNDLRFSDHGRFQIGTEGCQGANQILGELWVTYDVILMMPDQDVLGIVSACGNQVGDASYCPNYIPCDNPLSTADIICDTGIMGSSTYTGTLSDPSDTWAVVDGAVSCGIPFPYQIASSSDASRFDVLKKYLLPGYKSNPLWNTTVNANLHCFDWTMGRFQGRDPGTGYTCLIMKGLDGIDIPEDARTPGDNAEYFRVGAVWEVIENIDAPVGNSSAKVSDIGNWPVRGAYTQNCRIETQGVFTHPRLRPTLRLHEFTQPTNDLTIQRTQRVSYGVSWDSGGNSVVTYVEASIDIMIPHDYSARPVVTLPYETLDKTTGMSTFYSKSPVVNFTARLNHYSESDASFRPPINNDRRWSNTFRITSRRLTKAEYLLGTNSGTAYISPQFVNILQGGPLVGVPPSSDETEVEESCLQNINECDCASAHCNC